MKVIASNTEIYTGGKMNITEKCPHCGLNSVNWTDICCADGIRGIRSYLCYVREIDMKDAMILELQAKLAEVVNRKPRKFPLNL